MAWSLWSRDLVIGEVHPITGHEGPEVEQMCSSTLPSTSTLDVGWVVNETPRPLYPPGKEPGTHCTGGWVGPKAGLDGCGKFLPLTGIRSPDRPVRSESLYPTIGTFDKSTSDCASYIQGAMWRSVEMFPRLVHFGTYLLSGTLASCFDIVIAFPRLVYLATWSIEWHTSPTCPLSSIFETQQQVSAR